MTRPFTGWHMLAVMLAMFGTIITVNLIMARYAISTFGGTVVENSYVASQRYNGWLAKARAQKALGWTVDVTVDRRRHVEIVARDKGQPLAGAVVSAVATHPLGLEAQRTLRLLPTGNGRYVSDVPIAPGRWLLKIEVRSGGRDAFFDDEVPA